MLSSVIPDFLGLTEAEGAAPHHHPPCRGKARPPWPGVPRTRGQEQACRPVHARASTQVWGCTQAPSFLRTALPGRTGRSPCPQSPSCPAPPNPKMPRRPPGRDPFPAARRYPVAGPERLHASGAQRAPAAVHQHPARLARGRRHAALPARLPRLPQAEPSAATPRAPPTSPAKRDSSAVAPCAAPSAAT